MTEDGVKFLDQADIAAFFFLRMASLPPVRREMVLAKVPQGKDFDLVSLRAAMIRLFPDLARHEQTRFASGGRSPGGRGHHPGHRAHGQMKRHYRTVHETAHEDYDEVEDDDEEEEDE